LRGLHTFLRVAGADAQRGITTIGSVRTGIELLVAAPLQRRADVHKGVTLDLERAVGVAAVFDGSGLNTSESTSEGLEVVLAADGASEGEGEEREGDEGLHVDD
jgi:hypothetical protein